MKAYKFTLICPRCENVSEIGSADRNNPRANCGNCLMDDVEIVEMKVVSVKETDQ